VSSRRQILSTDSPSPRKSKSEAEEIDSRALRDALAGSEPPLVVDIREPYERALSYIPDSLHIPQDELEARAASALPDRHAPLALYCASGIRSLTAARKLLRMGYTQVMSLSGGIVDWEAEGFPVAAGAQTKRLEWSPRYHRQLRIPEVGPGGQKRLLESRVLVIGAGGLGSPVALYLAAAGIGHLGLVDFDTVDLSNLHRQVLFATGDVGQPKVHLAGARLKSLNPDVEVATYAERFTSANAERIANGYELIVDGTDNFATRYLVNDLCLKLGIPNVHGSIHRFEGQVSVFCTRGGPCYRCLFPEPPPPGTVPSCAEAGVLGVLPGVIGTLQATEAVKLLLGIGEPLVGRLLRFDALQMRFDEFQISRSADCAWCAPGAPFPGLIDYDDFCGEG